MGKKNVFETLLGLGFEITHFEANKDISKEFRYVYILMGKDGEPDVCIFLEEEKAAGYLGEDAYKSIISFEDGEKKATV